MRLPFLPLLSLAPLIALLPSSATATPEEAAPFLKEANTFLLAGSFKDAARAFTEALEKDESYVTLYKRATAYLSSGRSSAALEDFDSILKLNPTFSKAHLEKSKILLKDGSYASAREALQSYLKASPNDESATKMLASIKTAESSLAAARRSSKQNHWDACISSATSVLEVSPNESEAREIRASCWFGKGDLEDGIGDLTRLSALSPGNPDLSIKIASLSFFLLPTTSQNTAISHLKQCLHFDPDSKPCKKAHKALKALQKDFTKLDNFLSSPAYRPAITLLLGTTTTSGLISTFEDLFSTYHTSHLSPSPFPSPSPPLALSQLRLKLYAAACKSHVALSQIPKSQLYCEEVLKMDGENVDGLVGKGERLIKEESWQEAVRVLERAFENGGRSDREVMERLQRAQKLLKVSKQKDYYKVVGVSRDADARTIKKAYRNASKKAHPDKGGSEAKMAALNEAYEVLSNPELKARYDNGDDPNDQEARQQHHHNPFAQHGGSPFEFFQQQQQHGSPFGGGGGGGFRFRTG